MLRAVIRDAPMEERATGSCGTDAVTAFNDIE
jgi:hypothetical protein